MPKLTPIETEIDIKRLSKEKYSYRQIKNKLEKEDVDVSIATLCRVLKNIGIGRSATNNKQPVPQNQTAPIKRTPEVVQKVKRLVDKKNPATRRDIKKQTSLGLATIHKIIHKDLKLKTKIKTKVHKLTAEHKKNRKTNCRKLYENHLAGQRSEYAVTLDEALVYLEDSNRERRICYVKQGDPVPESWILEKDESFKNGFMIVGVITGRGTVPLLRVPSQVKINAQYYVDYVLKPLFTKLLPRLYENEMSKVFFHHDKAPSHTANLTKDYLDQLKSSMGISYLEKQDIPVKAPDASPLDFYGFGYLKQQLSKRKARTLDGVWKLFQEIWSQIDVETCQKVFIAWKRRCRLISAKNGEQIEHTKDIHRRRVQKL